MSVMSKLKEAGLDVELDKLLSKYLKGKDGGALKELRDAIDETGLKSPKTMKAVGSLQRTGKLEPGLYKELVALNKRFEDGEVGEPETSAPEAAEENSGGEAVVEEPVVQEETLKEGDTQEVSPDNVVTLEIPSLTDKEEEKIKEKMRKEEEKMRKRLLEREAKMRERIKARQEKRAQRQGLKLEVLQEVKTKKDELSKLREEMKGLREQAKKLREEIKSLRPKRKKKDAEGEEKPKKRKSKAKDAEADDAATEAQSA